MTDHNQALFGQLSIVPLEHAHQLSKLCTAYVVVAHSCITDIKWEPSRSAGGPDQYCTPCAFTLKSLLLHYFFLYQDPPDIFSNDDKILCLISSRGQR